MSFILLNLSACKKENIREEIPPEVLYEQGLKYMEEKKALGFIPNTQYDKSLESFQRVVDDYPYSEYATLAQLKIADVYFKKGDHSEAITQYEEFIKFHPTNENVPYAIYHIAKSYYEQILSIDRDQTATKNALTNFQRLYEEYPQSEFADDAKKKIESCRKNLAERELYIGEFYLRQNKYQSALARFNEVIKNYSDLKYREKALFLSSKSLTLLNENAQAKETLTTFLEQYPKSKYAREAKELLGSYK